MITIKSPAGNNPKTRMPQDHMTPRRDRGLKGNKVVKTPADNCPKIKKGN